MRARGGVSETQAAAAAPPLGPPEVWVRNGGGVACAAGPRHPKQSPTRVCGRAVTQAALPHPRTAAGLPPAVARRPPWSPQAPPARCARPAQRASLRAPGGPLPTRRARRSPAPRDPRQNLTGALWLRVARPQSPASTARAPPRPPSRPGRAAPGLPARQA